MTEQGAEQALAVHRKRAWAPEDHHQACAAAEVFLSSSTTHTQAPTAQARRAPPQRQQQQVGPTLRLNACGAEHADGGVCCFSGCGPHRRGHHGQSHRSAGANLPKARKRLAQGERAGRCRWHAGGTTGPVLRCLVGVSTRLRPPSELLALLRLVHRKRSMPGIGRTTAQWRARPGRRISGACVRGHRPRQAVRQAHAPWQPDSEHTRTDLHLCATHGAG